MESGTVQYFDVRQPKTAVFTLAAHTTACSAVDFNPFIPGMLVTGSGDRTVKVWDLADGGRASMVSSRDLTAGKVFSVGFSLDSPYHCVVGGSKGELTVWNITDDAGVRKTFEGREAPAGVVRMDGIGSLHALNAGLPVDETNASKSSMSLRKSKQAEEDEEDEEEDDTMEQVLQEMSGVALGGSGSKN